MHARALLIVLAACSSTANVYPPPGTPNGAAWQMFVVGPFRSVTSHGDVTSPTGEEPPTWTNDAHATMFVLARQFRVELTTGLGLRHEDCALEIITGKNRGIRVARPTMVRATSTARTSVWTGQLDTDEPGHAAMFCPFDSAHRAPPWGVTVDVR